MKHIWKKGFLALLMALIFTMAVPSIMPTETSMGTVEAASVKISATKATLIKGQTKTLKITGTSKKVKWSSSKESVATVNSKGKVTAVKKGSATITAKVGGKKYTCKVKVESPKISKTSATIAKGDTLTLKVSGTTQTVKWSSNKTSVAKVSSKGKVTAKKNGTATITAKVGGKKYKCTITVKTPKISQTSLSLTVGDTSTLKITGTTQSVTWSTSKKSVATVNKNGKVTAKAAGSATITASVGSKNLTCKVKVKSSSSSTSSSGLDITILSSTDITSSPVSKVSFKIKNNGSKTVKFDNFFTVVYYTSGYYKGFQTSTSPSIGLPIGDTSTTTSISPGETKTITITDDTYSFKGNANTYYNLWFTVGNSRYRYDFYPVSGKGTAVLIDD